MPAFLKQAIRQGLEKLALAMAALAVTGMVAIVGLIVTSVFMRKFANSPLHITEEMVGLLLSATLFLGLPMVTLKARHVRVALVADMMSGRAHILMQICALFIGVVLFAWLLTDALPWWEFAHRLSLKTETTRILLYPWMAVLPLSLALTGLIYLARLFGILDRLDDNSEPEG